VARPKQLLPLASSEPLLAATVHRMAPIVAPERVVVVTGAHLLDATRAVVPEVPAENFLAEPVPRNTAPAIAWATAEIARRDPDALCMVLPSDHFIAKPDAYIAAVKTALDGARRGYLTTLGIKPSRPETGFGYIEVGKEIAPHVNEAARFVEKPSLEVAQKYVASGNFLWNAGMFFYAAKAMNEALAEHLPDVASKAVECLQASALGRVFPTMQSISIDHGVMEKAKRVAVVPGDFGWSDVGSWQSSWELADKDDAGNAAPEGAIVIDGKNNLVWDRTGSGRTYALVGVSDLVVVETEDAVLIVPRERAQDVRLAVERLKSTGSKRV